MQLKATVLIPTHDRGPTLLRSVGSVLTQTVENIEIFIIGDGVPDITREIVTEIQKQDRRVRFFDNPKGDRHGELYRHAALAEARGEIVSYLADDDLYLPNHVEMMSLLLQKADFVNALPVRVDSDEIIGGWIIDLSLPTDRELILSIENRIPLSCGAHTLEMYRQLPYGWRTTPRGTPTDLYMWRQFLSDPRCHAISSTLPTVLVFPGPDRADLTIEQRCEELDRWNQRIANPKWKESFVKVVGDRAQQIALYRASMLRPS